MSIVFFSGKVKREELFIVTKLPEYAVHPDLVEEYLNKSLTALQLDYIDLYLIHFPVLLKKPEQPQGPRPNPGEKRMGLPPTLDPLPTDHSCMESK